jgi:hypothetical protein
LPSRLYLLNVGYGQYGQKRKGKCDYCRNYNGFSDGNNENAHVLSASMWAEPTLDI